jgi:hypothetical protein
MTVRSFVYGLLSADTELNALGLNANTWQVRGLSTPDTPQERPFGVIAWGATNKGMDVVNLRLLQIWVYDEPDDYERIDRALERVRNVLTSVVATRTGVTDLLVTQIKWEGHSGDLTDDSVGAIVRNSQYTVVGSAS